MSEINAFQYYELIDDIDFLYYFQILLFEDFINYYYNFIHKPETSIWECFLF